MANEASVEYAGKKVSLIDFSDARFAIETWAWKEYAFSDRKRYEDIMNLCTLAQGMWFKLSQEQKGGKK